MTDDEYDALLDLALLDEERAATLRQIADDVIRELDWQREDEARRIESDIARQMAAVERDDIDE